MSKYLCLPCGYVYDELKKDDKEHQSFEDLPINWRCPECNSTKFDFEKMGED